MLWRNLHHWQKFDTASSSDGIDKFHLWTSCEILLAIVFGHEIHISTPKFGQNSHSYSLVYQGGRGFTSLGNIKKQTIFFTSFLILWAFSLSIFGYVKSIAHAQVLHCLATLLTSFTFLSSSHQILLYRFVCKGVGWDWGEDVSAKVRFEETTQGLRRLHVFTQYTTLLVYEDGWKSKITYLGRF